MTMSFLLRMRLIVYKDETRLFRECDVDVSFSELITFKLVQSVFIPKIR